MNLGRIRLLPSGPVRLRARILTLVTALSLLGFVAMTGAGWLIVLQAEDRILDALVTATVPVEPEREATEAATWIETYGSVDALKAETGLERVPSAPGWYDAFASEHDRRAIVIEGWRDRARVWATPGMEREFRLLVPPPGGGPRYAWVDLTRFEYTEGRTGGIVVAVLLLAAAVALVALFVGGLVARWTLRPVMALALRVRNESRSEEGQPLAAGMADDEIGFLARALDGARSREAEAWARERRFIAECSHELRTPLATLRSSLALWPEVEGDPASRQRVIGRIERAVTRTEQWVRFFLVLAREERERSGGGSVALRDVVTDLMAEFKEQRGGEDPVWSVDLPAEARVEARRDVVVCVLHNLLDNALKHGRPRLITITWVKSGVLYLEDDGPGFPELREVPREEAARESAGYGLGWNLVERLCRVQGWSVTRARSALGGARVELRCRVARQEAGTKPAACDQANSSHA